MVVMFKKFVDLGIPRARARMDMLRFHQARLDHIERFNEEPDYIFLVIENKVIKQMPSASGPVPLTRDMPDTTIINFYRILSTIDSYSK
jgi:hypothetical protein